MEQNVIFEEDILLIAGPTASGKTALAIEAARRNNAVIINADSMQVYEDLQVLTARPDRNEQNQAPHRLFGHVDGSEPYGVARWLGDVAGILSDIRDGQKRVFVGGTGLYFTTLLNGLSPVPKIDQDIREKWRHAANVQSGRALYAKLQALDPAMAKVLRESDKQRIIRALEVMESTGKSLSQWQAIKGRSVLGSNLHVRKLLLMPERSVLHARINARFDRMLDKGAVEEVEALLKRNLSNTLPVMKAIGVPQIGKFLNGEVSLDMAAEHAKAASRQYAKRQSTWFKNSFDHCWVVKT